MGEHAGLGDARDPSRHTTERRVRFILKEVSEQNGLPGGARRTEISREQLPVPELTRFALVEMLGLSCHGPFEKVRWIVGGAYKGHHFTLAHEKFGVRLYLADAAPVGTEEALLSNLRRATRALEPYLKRVADGQIAAGNITLSNEYNLLSGGYHFFRAQAERAYGKPDPAPDVTRTNEDGEPVGWSGPIFVGLREGGYLASAMLDAYFSRLEHLLVIGAAFYGDQHENGWLKSFVASFWGEKFKTLFELSTDRAAKRTYDALREIKDVWRNTTAHGRLRQNGESFHFHVAGYGALPALLTRFESGWRAQASLVPEKDFGDICAVLDAADELFRYSAIRFALTLAESGLPVSFDPESRSRYRAAAVDEVGFDLFLQRECEIHDRHANMDYYCWPIRERQAATTQIRGNRGLARP